jgi:LPXTG-motif cell wall-anchored protein
MLLAAMLAMVLAAAAPAFAQSAVAGSVQYVDCDEIQAAVGQYQYATDAEDFSAIAQELGVSQNQVLACFESVAAGRDINVGASAQYAATSTATATATASASAASASASALPSTGGVSVPGAIALGAGVLLVAGGLLARRIIR